MPADEAVWVYIPHPEERLPRVADLDHLARLEVPEVFGYLVRKYPEVPGKDPLRPLKVYDLQADSSSINLLVA